MNIKGDDNTPSKIESKQIRESEPEAPSDRDNSLPPIAGAEVPDKVSQVAAEPPKNSVDTVDPEIGSINAPVNVL